LTDSKYDPALNLPMRQTASIFKQPVTLITNHKNEPAKVENQTTVKNNNNDKPRPVQVCIYFNTKNLFVENFIF
jgi:hypothetical protein